MKVLIQNEGTELRGSEQQILLLAGGLLDRGHEVLVSCHPDGDLRRELDERGLRTTPIRPRGDLDLVSALRFQRLLRREAPDAVLLTAFRRLYWATWAARRAGVRVVVRLGMSRTLKRWKYRAAFRRVDAVVANARRLADRIQAAGDLPPDAVHVVWNGVAPPEPTPGALREEVGVGEEPLLLSLGSLAHRKGFDLLFDAMTDVRGHLAIAGSGPDENELREQVRRLGLEDRVHFLGWRDDGPRLLGDADLLVLASRAEGMPVAVLEAMAAGVPVVATDVGEVHALLSPRGDRPPAGWVVPPEDTAALAGALKEAATALTTGEARARGVEGAVRAREWLGPDRMAREYEAILFPAEEGAKASAPRGAGGMYEKWKAWWRRLETSDPVWHLKRAVRMRTGREPRARVEIQVDVREHGDWRIHPPALPPGSTVFSFGVGRDLRFERALATRYDARVTAFDPTPWTQEWIHEQELPGGLSFAPVGVAGYDGTATFLQPDRPDGSHSMIRRPSQTGDEVEVQVRRLSTLVREHGLSRLDLLKLDVEGAEYDAIEDLVQLDLDVPQVLVEFHHRFERLNPHHTRQALDRLAARGYRIFSISPDGRDFSFLRPDLVS